MGGVFKNCVAVVCVCVLLLFPAYASDSWDMQDIDPVRIVVEEPEEDAAQLPADPEDDEPFYEWVPADHDEEEDESDEDEDISEALEELPYWEALFEMLESLPLGYSGAVAAVEVEVPPIHELFPSVSTRSIATQPAYPYTGGAFIAAITNYGTGVMVLPESYKTDTFGFVKGTDRVVNLTNVTVSGYWVMGGTTYQLRFTTYGEAQYYVLVSGTYTWRSLTVSAMTDSNVQFLDETGERGIQRPSITLTDRLLVVFMVLMILVQGVSILKR